MRMLFSPPKEWQDWVSVLLGIWICVSPSALYFTGDSTATHIALYVGFFMIAAEVFTLSPLGVLEEFIDVALGAWLLVSVWLFGISTPAARFDMIVSGFAVLLFSFYEIWDSRRASGRN
jgi:FtsH-binding integral membrane protein